MKLLILLFLPFLAFSQNCPDDFWKQAVLAGQTTVEIQLVKGQAYKPVIIERADTNTVETWVLIPKSKLMQFLEENCDTPPKPDIVTNIDNVVSDTRNKYTGTWEHPSATTWLSTFYEKTGSYTFTNGSYLETTFDGYKIEWYTERKSDKGIAGISIANLVGTNWVYGDEVELDLYATTTANNSQLAWTISELTNGPHKIKIRYTGKKNPAALVPTIIHDYFKTFKAQ